MTIFVSILLSLSLLYVLRGDYMSRFHNALFLGDAEERMKVLETTGQTSLAYITAASHGLDEDAQRLLDLLNANGTPIPAIDPKAALLQPPTPIIRTENWPLLAVGKSLLADLAAGGAAGSSGVRGISASGDEGEEFQDANGTSNQTLPLPSKAHTTTILNILTTDISFNQ
jgi:Coatomer WD associated region